MMQYVYVLQVFKFLKDSASGHIITAVTAIVGLAVKIVSDKIDALQEETRKDQAETRKDQAETKKEIGALQKETRKELGLIAQALNSLRIELKTKFVEQDTNLAWMRGDYGVVNRGSGRSIQGTKSSSMQPSGEEERSPEGEDDSATNP
jgi:heme exporter protein D